MIKGTMINAEKYRDKVRPFFNTMRWEAETTTLPPEDNIIVHSVMRPKIGGGRERVSEIAVKDVIDGCLNETGAAPEREAAEPTPLEKLIPINATIYSKYLAPYFDRLSWTVKCRLNEFGGVVITGARDEHGNLVNEDALVFAARKGMPCIDPPGLADGTWDVDLGAEPFNMKIPDSMEIPDYTKIREDPGNDRLMKEYAARQLTIHRYELTETVKPAFVDKGLIYSGEHYGDGSVQIQSVVNYYGIVIPLETVCGILDGLEIPYSVKPPEADLEIKERRKDPAEGSFPRVEFAPDEDIEIGERSPGEFDQDELDRQEAAAVMEPEETEGEPGRTLVLLDEEAMTLKGVYSPPTQRVSVELHLGSNIIVVDCTQAQFTNFFNGANVVCAMLAAYETKKTKETTEDER